MKIGVTSCTQSSLKTKGKGQQTISRRAPLLQQPLYLTETSLSGSRVRRSQGMVSCTTTREPIKRHTSTTLLSDIACFARIRECLIKCICRIVPWIVRACIPTGQWGMEWEDLWELVLILWNSIKSLKINVRRSWNISRSRTRCYIASPRSPYRSVTQQYQEYTCKGFQEKLQL